MRDPFPLDKLQFNRDFYPASQEMPDPGTGQSHVNGSIEIGIAIGIE
jgi:hypothetical protein